MTGGALDAIVWRGYNLRTMSHDRRTFLKTLTLGGVALFTDDWFKLVAETKEASQGKQLPVHPAAVYGKGCQELNAFWSAGEGYALYLNGTPYDEPPTRTYRQKLEAAASVFLRDLIRGLRADREEIRLADAIEAEGLRFVDGACPGNDTLVCAYANDYDTLAALQRILGARGHNCRVIILQANPADIAPAGD